MHAGQAVFLSRPSRCVPIRWAHGPSCRPDQPLGFERRIFPTGARAQRSRCGHLQRPCDTDRQATRPTGRAPRVSETAAIPSSRAGFADYGIGRPHSQAHGPNAADRRSTTRRQAPQARRRTSAILASAPPPPAPPPPAEAAWLLRLEPSALPRPLPLLEERRPLPLSAPPPRSSAMRRSTSACACHRSQPAAPIPRPALFPFSLDR